MVWTRIVVDDTKSVAFNATTLNGNAAYIEDSMQLDHYWDEGSNLDGHHRVVQMPNEASDPSLATDMDAAFYVKDDADSKTVGFFRSAEGVYQFVPRFASGTVSLPNTNLTTITAVPANVYGEIVMWTTASSGTIQVQSGFFVSNGTQVFGWSNSMIASTSATVTTLVALDNLVGTATLNLGCRREGGAAGTWYWRITYRDV